MKGGCSFSLLLLPRTFSLLGLVVYKCCSQVLFWSDWCNVYEVECNGFCFLLRSFLKSISFPGSSPALPSLSLTSVIDFAYYFHRSIFPSFRCFWSPRFSLSLSLIISLCHLFWFPISNRRLISSAPFFVSLYKFSPFSSPRSSPQFNRSRVLSLVLSTFLSILPTVVLYPLLHLF